MEQVSYHDLLMFQKENVSMPYVNVYKVTRVYGGPEEGGWWYNYHEFIEGKYCSPNSVENTKKKLLHKYEHEVVGDIYSVAGGVEIHIITESHKGVSFPEGRQRYE